MEHRPEDNFKGATGYRWEPGESGNPEGGGRPGNKHSITWWYKKLLAENDGASAKSIATEAINKAKQGYLPHIVEVTDRTDGKVVDKHLMLGLMVHVGDEYALKGLEANKLDLQRRLKGDGQEGTDQA